MFHQIHLLPADKPVLCFLWRGMNWTDELKAYKWQVLPFGTTCSPCCAIYAISALSALIDCVEQSFYMDNCLHSTDSKKEGKDLVDGLHRLLHTGDFEIHQWARNVPAVTEHLPSEVRSESSELCVALLKLIITGKTFIWPLSEQTKLR